MKNKLIVFGVALLVGLMLSSNVSSQTSAQTVEQNVSLKVDGSALLAVVGKNGDANTDVNISLSGASQAGAEVGAATNTDTRLRISSLVSTGTRNITASISEDMSTSGTTLSLELIKPLNFQPTAAMGGLSSGPQDITSAVAGSGATLVTGITNCWSGTGATDGYTIKYVYAKKVGATVFVAKNVKITFTITDES